MRHLGGAAGAASVHQWLVTIEVSHAEGVRARRAQSFAECDINCYEFVVCGYGCFPSGSSAPLQTNGTFQTQMVSPTTPPRFRAVKPSARTVADQCDIDY